MSTITFENGQLVLNARYEQGLVMNIKSIPYAERKWDANRKVWLIDPKHAKMLKNWIFMYLNEDVSLPVAKAEILKPVTQLYEVRYVGTTKPRDDGSVSSFGLVGNDWKLIFPEQVLRNWFDAGNVTPGTDESLYALLGIGQIATEDEIKNAYRRMAKIWHTDICKEPNAKEMFILIQNAYEILSNPMKRAKYNAGLKLQASLISNKPKDIYSNLSTNGYRSPIRSGYIMVEGIEKLGRFIVDSILAWEDIRNNKGQILVASWPLGAKEPLEVWA